MFRFYVSLLAVLILSAVSLSFDYNYENSGAIARPGYNNLQVDYTTNNNTVSKSGIYYENKVAGTPRAATFQYESGISPKNADQLAYKFINEHEDIIKNSANDFRVTSNKLVLDKFYFTNLVQTYDGVDVYGSRLALRVTPAGKVFFAGGEVFTDIELDVQPSLTIESARDIAVSGITFSAETDAVEFVDTYVLPLIYDDYVDYRLCHKFYVNTKDPVADWLVFIDAADGSIIWRTDVTRYETVSGNISGMIQPSNPYEEYQQEVFANMNIYFDGTDTVTTDSEGNFSYEAGSSDPVEIEMQFEGPYTNVINYVDDDTEYSDEVTPGDQFDLIWSDDNSTMPERNAYYHCQVIHDFVKALDPDLDAMDGQLTCNVNVTGSCNAYYSTQYNSVNFYAEGDECPNIALIADVIYHEWGHGLTCLSYTAGGSEEPDDATHEAFSDFIASLITNQSKVGNGFLGEGTYLRDLDNEYRYPDDWTGECHNDGQILGGALWDLKEFLDDDRPNYIDTLWHFAKYGYGLDFESYFWDVLVVDDDDGDIDNGTPHAYEIYYSFGDLHGIGPGVHIEMSHTSIIDSEDSTVTYPVSVEVFSIFDMDEGSVTLYYSTGGDYTTIDLVNSSGNEWTGEIPRQSLGTTINYYIEAIDNNNMTGYLPDGAPDSVYTFYVGIDYIPPTLSDEEGRQSNTININGKYGEFSFAAWDIHGVDESSGEFYYKINDGSEVEISMTFDSSSEKFVLDELDMGEILQVGDVVYYYFTCNDLSSQQNIGRLPEENYFSFEIANSELIGDFEDSLGNWAFIGDGWVLCDDRGYDSDYCIKTGETLYSNNDSSIAYLSDPIDCSLFDGLWLEFYHIKRTYEGDSCFIVAANDPEGSWQVYDRLTDNSTTWKRHVSDLSAIVGEGNEEVYIGLQFISDDSNYHLGVFADYFILHVEEPTAVEDYESLPQKFSLNQNYPNPFNLKTIISFSLAENIEVNLEVFDILGRKVRGLVDGVTLEAGNHQVVWDGLNENGEVVTSGIYFYRLTYGDNKEVKSMTLLK